MFDSPQQTMEQQQQETSQKNSESGTISDKMPENDPTLPTADENAPKEEWEDILGTGSILKKIVKHGAENTRPQRLDICTINYKCTLEDGTEVESGDKSLVQLSDLEVIQGVDLALALMNVGEMCQLRIEPRLAFGGAGLDTRVPPDTPVLYELELLTVEPEEEIEKLTISQRKQMGDIKKLRGNWWYGRGECTFAIQCYRRALDYLDEVEGGISDPIPENDDPSRRELTDAALQNLMEDRINVCNNMAAAQMKLGAYDAALQSLQIVLRCQPNNVKALYRKSKVLKAKNEVKEALKCLQRAKELEPENATIQKEIQEIQTILQKHKNYEKELARRMFNQSGQKDQPKKNSAKTAGKTSYMWASVALSVVVGIAGVAAWRFKFS